MRFSASSLCSRLLLFAIRKPCSCHYSHYMPIFQQQRLCSTPPRDEFRSEESFEEFEETPAIHELLTNIDFEEIVGDDLDKKKKLQVYISELNMKMSTQKLVAPKRLQTKQWKHLLQIKSNADRLSYLKRLYFKENRAEVKASCCEEKRASRHLYRQMKKTMPEEVVTTSSPVTYRLNKTSLFFRLYAQSMKLKYNYNLMMAAWFGPDLVVDCSYEEYMTPSEVHGCSRQILYMWSYNRTCKVPFNIIFCNLNPEGKLKQHLTSLFHLSKDDVSLLNLTEKSYTDLYPTKQLVYLSPHCEEELEKYDGNSVYIIGAYVDEIVNKPISLKKAKQNGLRTVKFPLDKNLNWVQGSKLLPINQVIWETLLNNKFIQKKSAMYNKVLAIMGDLKDGYNWDFSLRHIAVRKQTFQAFEKNDLEISDKQAKNYIRNSACRDMLRELNIRRVFNNNKKADCSHDGV